MNRLFVASAVALSLYAVGCAAPATTSESSAQEINEAPAALTQVVDTSAGKVLADATHGLSLYTFDRDTTTESTCYNACATAWPPLLVAAGTTVAAPYATTTRHDGKLQVTLSGHPIYFYVGDEAQGDVNGDGLGGVWHLARPVTTEN